MLFKELNMAVSKGNFQGVNVMEVKLTSDHWGCGLSPVDNAPVHHFKNNDPLCAVFKELSHFTLQLGFGFVLGYYL